MGCNLGWRNIMGQLEYLRLDGLGDVVVGALWGNLSRKAELEARVGGDGTMLASAKGFGSPGADFL